MEADTFTFLRSLDLFRSLPEEGLRELARVCREESYESGKVVFPEGAAADCLFIIVDGEVEVWKGHGGDEAEIIAHLDKGDIFGEMALVDRMPRSATVVTSRPTRLLAVAEKDFQDIIQKSPPVALAIQSLLSQRMRRSTGRFVEDLQRKNKDLERALEELKRVQDELISRERLSTVGRFASLILHDARQPIAAVMANADLLLRRDNLPAETREFAGQVRSDIKVLDDMVREMLDYSRGDIRLDIAEVEVAEFLADLERRLRKLVSSREIDLEVRSTFDGVARFDRERMARVFFNLAKNAVKAMGRSGRLTVTSGVSGKELVFTVTDTGEGMDAETLKQIFEPFFSSSSRGGTGLGMVAVRNIVEAHGGSVTIDSSPAGGTTAHIHLPLG
jgi:signal transduction histidine kinase